MKRNNGYIELKYNSLFNELVSSNEITILNRNKNCFYINSHKLFFKEEDNIYLELIGSKICNLLNIDSVNNDALSFISLDKTFKGVISNDFRKEDYRLIKMDDIINDYLVKNNDSVKYNEMNFDLINKAITYRYKNYSNSDYIINRIMNNLKKYFLLDILIGNIDNGKYNYEFMENNNDSIICPYFDFGQIFKFSSTRFTVSDSNNYNVYDNLYEFLLKEKEYQEIFIDMYNMLTPLKVEELFKEIENDIDYKISDNIKNIVFLSYSRHYQLMGEVLNNLTYDNKIKR